MANSFLLAGDVGGTKTKMAVYSSESGPRAPLAESTYASGQYPGLKEIIDEFLAEIDLAVDRASFGVAGPVLRGRATITNLNWVMEESELREALGLSSLRLWNDLLAIASSVPILEPQDLEGLRKGKAEPQGARAVIAPGTGLGEAFLTWDGSRYRAHASEGGHTDFAPTNDLELGLLRYLWNRHEHVSYELVCSGRGIPNIYAYLRESGRAPEPDWLAEKLADVQDPTPIIVDSALDSGSKCELCVATLETFVSILAAEAGNLALKVLATGGVYLGGGIPPRILSSLKGDAFFRSFASKGRLEDLLSNVPVFVITNPESALLGAARLGLTE